MTLGTVLVFALVVSGCAARPAPRETCTESVCPPTPSGSAPDASPVASPSLPLPNVTLPHAQLLGCEQTLLGIELPNERVRAIVPNAFRVVGLTPSTARILIWFHNCERSVNETAVLGATRLYHAFAFVVPVNESWKNQREVNYYMLDAASDNPALVASLKNWSMPVVPSQVTGNVVPGAADSSVQQWKVDAGSWSATFEAALVRDTVNPQNLTFAANLWYGSGPFHRITYKDVATRDALPWGGELVYTGESQVGKAILGATASYSGEFERRANEIYQLDGSWREET